jgi:hypothetical protein
MDKRLIVIIIFLLCSSIGYAVYSDVQISVSVKSAYHTYTIALDQRQDYYVECDGVNLLNVTPIGDPIPMEGISGLCYGG